MDRKHIKISEWNRETEGYSRPLVTENHVLDALSIEKPRSEAERKERAASLLGVDQSLFSCKIEAEKPKGVLPVKRETPAVPSIRFLDDPGAGRVYVVADNVSKEIKTEMERFASQLLSSI